MRKFFAAGWITLFVLSGCAKDDGPVSKEEGRRNTLLLLLLGVARVAPACPGQAAIKWSNTAGSSQNLGLFTNAICTTAVTGTQVTLNSGQSSVYACFVPGAYYSGSASVCAANTLTYAANKNYTKSFDGTNFATTTDN